MSPSTRGSLGKKRKIYLNDQSTTRKRRRTATAKESADTKIDFFDTLPNDLIMAILCKLSSVATSPADLTHILLTCKRMYKLSQCPQVLQNASAKSLAVLATNWSQSAHSFLQRCADAGNFEACYTLGMIEFYCLQNRQSGATLMARAAMSSHAAALYSLAIIHFNGSGGSKKEKNLVAGVSLCARAAFLGNTDALRELGHCLQDGYGVRRNIGGGRKFLIRANTQELAAVVSTTTAAQWLAWSKTVGVGCPLLSDYGYTVPPQVAHPANRFMVDWFRVRGEEGVSLCSHGGCGRPETRENEFRRCSVCGVVKYCSRACQALHWKLAHRVECSPLERFYHDAAAVALPEPAETTV